MIRPLRLSAVLSTVAILALASLDASAATIRVRCDQSATRSKISVDAAELAFGNYRARVMSGSNVRNSDWAATVGDEVEFDFDSATGQVGATRISPEFIQNLKVTAKIVDEAGRTVVLDTEFCQQR